MGKAYIFTAALLCALLSAGTLSAQNTGDHIIIDGKKYELKEIENKSGSRTPAILEVQTLKLQKPLRIDWLEEPGVQRYTVGIRPLQRINSGLKADFGFELNKPGRWLQFELAGYLTPRYSKRHGNSSNAYFSQYGSYVDEGWISFLSGFDEFEKFGGAGLTVTYKHIFSRSGWYVSYAASFNYYSVLYRNIVYEKVSFTDEYNQTFYEDKSLLKEHRVRFSKPGLAVNIGKHFALGNRVYVDMYCGLGYVHSFYDDKLSYTYDYSAGYNPILDGDDMYSFGYRGFILSGGLRLGFLWGR